MIKIIAGTYGHWNGSRVVPKTSKDEPFEVSPEQEERLIKLGVAVHVDDVQSATALEPETAEPETAEPETAESETAESEADGLPVQLEDMSIKELKKFAEAYDVVYKVGMKKADFIEAINAAIAEKEAEIDENEEIDDGEEPPTFDATEAVQ